MILLASALTSMSRLVLKVESAAAKNKTKNPPAGATLVFSPSPLTWHTDSKQSRSGLRDKYISPRWRHWARVTGRRPAHKAASQQLVEQLRPSSLAWRQSKQRYYVEKHTVTFLVVTSPSDSNTFKCRHGYFLVCDSLRLWDVVFHAKMFVSFSVPVSTLCFSAWQNPVLHSEALHSFPRQGRFEFLDFGLRPHHHHHCQPTLHSGFHLWLLFTTVQLTTIFEYWAAEYFWGGFQLFFFITSKNM